VRERVRHTCLEAVVVDEPAYDVDLVVLQRLDDVGRLGGEVDQLLLLEEVEVALGLDRDLESRAGDMNKEEKDKKRQRKMKEDTCIHTFRQFSKPEEPVLSRSSALPPNEVR
jgi:hypothetical protein